MVTLYHGAKTQIIGHIQKISPVTQTKEKPKTDFGRGFYMTDDLAFARIASCGVKGAEPYLYRFEIETTDLKVFVFEPSISWLMFVGANRHEFAPGINRSFEDFFRKVTQNYDLIIGPIANDRSFRVINQFFAKGGYQKTCDIALLTLIGLRGGRQYAAVTEQACRAVENSIVEITDLGPEIHKIIDERGRRYDAANKQADETEQVMIDMRLAGYRNPYQITFYDILKMLESGTAVDDIDGWNRIDSKRIYKQIDGYLTRHVEERRQGGWENGR